MVGSGRWLGWVFETEEDTGITTLLSTLKRRKIVSDNNYPNFSEHYQHTHLMIVHHFKTTFMCPLRESRSIRSGTSGLPYYCTPPVTVPAVLGVPAVWRITTTAQRP